MIVLFEIFKCDIPQAEPGYIPKFMKEAGGGRSFLI